MKFALIDRVLELAPGEKIVAVKNIALAEEYLQDHFPAFPVLPGVFMIQTMVEAASWLLRASTDFAWPLVTLAEVRNVKYQSFVAPGDQLRVEITSDGEKDGLFRYRGVGSCGERVAVNGRFSLRAEKVADIDGGRERIDDAMLAAIRRRWELIKPA